MQTKQQLMKFILVGCLNTLFGYSCYALFIFMGMAYPIALLLSTCAGILFNFKTMGRLVFSSKGNDNFLRFVVAYTLIYFLNIVFIKGIQLVTPNLYLAGFIAMIPAAIIAFTLNKYIVFREPHEAN